MNPKALLRDWPVVLFTVATVGALLWLVAMVALSLRSEGRQLELGQEKTIGFFDPHFQVSVSAVEELGDDALPWVERGEDERLLLVSVRSRVDSVEIEIDPGFLRLDVVDRTDRRFAPLVLTGPDQTIEFGDRLTRVLGPGESAEQSFLFRLPRDAAAPSLWIRDSLWIVRLIPGTETSFFHPKTVFILE